MWYTNARKEFKAYNKEGQFKGFQTLSIKTFKIQILYYFPRGQRLNSSTHDAGMAMVMASSPPAGHWSRLGLYV